MPRSSLSFIETFMVSGGELQAGDLHQERMLRTLTDFGVEASQPILQSLLSATPWLEVESYLTKQTLLPSTIYRLTLEYDLTKIRAIRLIPYQRRSISKLRLVQLPESFDYSYKYADRCFFDRVKATLPDDEEPLFVRQDGTITDTSFTNILVETEEGYFTPTDPLLKGIQREYLLRCGLIAEHDHLTLTHLTHARSLLLINALLPLEDALCLPPTAIHF
ncbi:aminotransferase class IV [Porphyromonas sp.]